MAYVNEMWGVLSV